MRVRKNDLGFLLQGIKFGLFHTVFLHQFSDCTGFV